MQPEWERVHCGEDRSRALSSIQVTAFLHTSDNQHHSDVRVAPVCHRRRCKYLLDGRPSPETSPPATWSRLLHKNVNYGGHADFYGLEAQLRETGSPSWRAWEHRITFEGFVEREFINTEDLVTRFAALLGDEPNAEPAA